MVSSCCAYCCINFDGCQWACAVDRTFIHRLYVTPHFEGIPDSSSKGGLEESFPHGRCGGTNAAKAATAIVAARFVVLRPEALAGVSLAELYIPAGFFEPFIQLLPVAGGEASLGAGHGGENLRPRYNHSLDWLIIHYLGGESVEGHLIIRVEKREPVFR